MHSKKSKTKPRHSLRFEALGTPWSIESDVVISDDLQATIYQTLDEFDHAWSRFRSDSTVTLMGASAGWYDLDDNGIKLIKWYERLYAMTHGLVTPLVGQTLADSGYDAAYSLRTKQNVARTPAWNDCLDLQGSQLRVKQPCLIDVGAAGKGTAVDIVVELLRQNNHQNFTVDASGDIYTTNPETIGLEHPFDASKIIGTVALQNKSVCGSASNRRTWSDGLHHIINPSTSQPTNDIIATWAIADTAMIADGISTALFFTSPETLRQHVAFDYITIRKDGLIAYSKHKDITIFSS